MTTNPQIATKPGSDVQVGDMLEFLGRFYLVTEIVDASEATKFFVPDARIARSNENWGMTLDPRMLYRVAVVAR
jgi:hypothetical protein